MIFSFGKAPSHMGTNVAFVFRENRPFHFRTGPTGKGTAQLYPTVPMTAIVLGI